MRGGRKGAREKERFKKEGGEGGKKSEREEKEKGRDKSNIEEG